VKKVPAILAVVATAFVIIVVLWWNIPRYAPEVWKRISPGMTRGDVHLLTIAGKHGDYAMERIEYYFDEPTSILQGRFTWNMEVTYDKGEAQTKNFVPENQGERLKDVVIAVNIYSEKEWVITFWPPGVKRKWKSM
jgi:hypothetical protein